jgi:hypothetical protein
MVNRNKSGMSRAWIPATMVLAACTASQPVMSGGDDYYSAQELRYEDHIYSPTVHTVQVFKKGFELSPPIIGLGTTDQLVLRFDDFSPDPQNLSFTVVHCNDYWQPSDLAPGQYL